jgi:hypothetical protein
MRWEHYVSTSLGLRKGINAWQFLSFLMVSLPCIGSYDDCWGSEVNETSNIKTAIF